MMSRNKLSFGKVFLSLLLTAVCTTSLCVGFAQGKSGRPMAHAHNDYEHERPFFHAFSSGFGSIEADIHLVRSELYVGHDAQDIRPDRTLATLYLDPLERELAKTKGKVRGKKGEVLYLLIDIKTEALATLEALVKKLENYPGIRSNNHIIIAISGNRPKPEAYANYPEFIHFDGRPSEVYDAGALKRVALISDNYYKYAKWNGTGTIPGTQREALKVVMEKAHALNKPFRFWASPDTEECWQLFMEMGADFINTDKIDALAAFMKNK